MGEPMTLLHLMDPQPLSRVPLRRPRFTASEVLVLNALVNSSPTPVPISRLVRLVNSYSARQYPTSADSIRQHIVNLRAKLGEKAFEPTLIITEVVEYPDGTRETAYLYRGGD